MNTHRVSDQPLIKRVFINHIVDEVDTSLDPALVEATAQAIIVMDGQLPQPLVLRFIGIDDNFNNQYKMLVDNPLALAAAKRAYQLNRDCQNIEAYVLREDAEEEAYFNLLKCFEQPAQSQATVEQVEQYEEQEGELMNTNDTNNRLTAVEQQLKTISDTRLTALELLIKEMNTRFRLADLIEDCDMALGFANASEDMGEFDQAIEHLHQKQEEIAAKISELEQEHAQAKALKKVMAQG